MIVEVLEKTAERIKAARIKKGLSLANLGKRIGRSHSALSRIENGGNTEKATLIALARELEDDFGDAELTKFAHPAANNQEKASIENLSVEEFISLKFGIGKPEKLSKRRKDELMNLAKILDQALEDESFDDG